MNQRIACRLAGQSVFKFQLIGMRKPRHRKRVNQLSEQAQSIDWGVYYAGADTCARQGAPLRGSMVYGSALERSVAGETTVAVLQFGVGRKMIPARLFVFVSLALFSRFVRPLSPARQRSAGQL